MDDEGRLVPHSAQIADYVYWPVELGALSLWEYVVQVEKKQTSSVSNACEDNEAEHIDGNLGGSNEFVLPSLYRSGHMTAK